MSAKAQLKRVNALSYRFKRQYLGSYMILADVDSEGNELSYWDGMKGRPTTLEEIDALTQKGWEVVMRCFPFGYLGRD
jgi:hypothetical protein